MPARLWLAFATLLSLAPAASAQTTYTWNGGSGNWSAAGNWTPSGSPDAGDTANITPTISNQVVTYDAAAPGSLSTLNLIPTTNGFINTLDVQRNLTVTNAVMVGGVGTVTMQLSPQAGVNPNLTVTSGLTVAANGRLIANSLYNGTTVYRATTITGNVTQTGGVVSYGPPAGTQFGSATHTVTGGYIMTGGSMFVTGGTTFTFINRLVIQGNLAASGGTITLGLTEELTLRGATNSVVGATFGTFGGASQPTGRVNLSLNGNQSLIANSPLPAVSARSDSTTLFAKTIGHATPGAVLDVTRLEVSTGVALGFGLLALSSDVRTNSPINPLGLGAGLPSSGAKAQVGVRLAGHTLDLSQNGVTSWTAPNGGSATAGVRWLFDSAPSGGVLRAAGFNLTGPLSGVGVLGGVTLHANGGNGTVLNLTTTPGATEGNFFDASSRILYTGHAAVATPAVLTADRPLGAVEVGGASSGVLSINSNVTLAGGLRVNGTGTAQLTNVTATLTGSANLTGSGSVTGTTTASRVVFGSGATGGIAPGTVGTVGTLTLGGTLAPEAIRLASTNTSRFDIASDSSFDRLNMAGNGIRYGGTLNLNFTYTPGTATTTTYALFQNLGGTFDDFSSVTNNLNPGQYLVNFDGTTGVLTVTPVPEPMTVFGVAALGLAVIGAVRRSRTTRSPTSPR
jgi:hypothetical protein